MGFLSKLKKLVDKEENSTTLEAESTKEEAYSLEIDEEDKLVVALAASVMAGKEKNNSHYHISKIIKLNRSLSALEEIGMKKYVIKLNGKVYEVEMEEVTPSESSALEAKTQIKEAPAASKAATGAAEVIEAPMPGTVLSFSVNEGDRVRKGDLLLILEAMKMENEIVSPVDGRVSLIAAKAGQSVNAGEVLLKIE